MDRRRRGAVPSLTISGITKDTTGTPIGGATVQLFRTDNDALVVEVVSDASGAFAINVANDTTYYLVAYKAGSPDVAGTTVNTIQGT